MERNLGAAHVSFLREHHMRLDRRLEIFSQNRTETGFDVTTQCIAGIGLLAP